MCQGYLSKHLGVMTDDTNRQTASSPRGNPLSSSPPNPGYITSENSLLSMQNDKSAFEITSVSDAPPDAEEDATNTREEQELKTPHSDHGRVAGGNYRRKTSGASSEDLQELKYDTHLASSSMTDMADHSGKPLSNGPSQTAQLNNGPTQTGQSRFRRMKNYIRGRWNCRDTLEPEERPDSENKITTFPPTSSTVKTTPLYDSSSFSSPTSSRRPPHQDIETQSKNGSEASYAVENNTHLRDHFSTMDRSSTTNDTLSRNTSLSSVHTAAERADDDQVLRLHEVDELESLSAGDRVVYQGRDACTLSMYTCTCVECYRRCVVCVTSPFG